MAAHTTTKEVAAMSITRTFRHYVIVWDRGAEWSFYSTAAEAQAQIDFSRDGGKVEARDFTITFDRPLLLEMNNQQIAKGAVELVSEVIG